MKLDRILVPLDGEERSIAALRAAAELRERYGSELVLLHVAVATEIPVENIPHHPDDAGRVLTSDERRIHDQAASVLGAASDVRIEVVYGDPVLEIARAVERLGVDAMVVTLKHRTRVGKLLLGGKAQEILLTAQVPVICVHSE